MVFLLDGTSFWQICHRSIMVLVRKCLPEISRNTNFCDFSADDTQKGQLRPCSITTLGSYQLFCWGPIVLQCFKHVWNHFQPLLAKVWSYYLTVPHLISEIIPPKYPQPTSCQYVLTIPATAPLISLGIPWFSPGISNNHATPTPRSRETSRWTQLALDFFCMSCM